MQNKTVKLQIPVLARVEGEGALELVISENRIRDLKLRIYEPPRFFEKFLEGRAHREVIDIVARICGICPVAYQMSAVHAIESIFGLNPGPWVRDMRRLMYCGEWIESHALHIHLLAAPDFLGFDSALSMAERYPDEVRRGLHLQNLGNRIISLLGGRSVHPVGVCVGGFHRAPSASDAAALRQDLIEARQDARGLVSWVAKLDFPDDAQEFTSVALHHPDEYPMNEGRIISSNGLNIAIDEYREHFSESQTPHSTALYSGLHGKPYLLGPLARLNLNHAQIPPSILEPSSAAGIAFPSRNMFHSIVARAIEIHYALEEAIRLLQDYRSEPQPFSQVQAVAGTGYGCTEAPRGLLWHRYRLDTTGIVETAEIVPPTSQNQARIEQDLKAALEKIGLDSDETDIRRHSEMVIRNYDPCISCATHFLKLRVSRE
jgi:coenzyme F420-reducing hydrogenase alpha subunit